ncbi:MAG: hypothetical protein HY266_04190 [Deltaproteobacteria bacterium]|nr:hypothetical protein [Deltaproteobacteria bacterium]
MNASSDTTRGPALPEGLSLASTLNANPSFVIMERIVMMRCASFAKNSWFDMAFGPDVSPFFE